MRVFAVVVFGLHVLFELGFGINTYLSGASSGASAAEIATQSTQASISMRFLASGQIALAVLGVLVLLGSGVLSQTARVVAAGLLTFHALGALGIVIAALGDGAVWGRVFSMGALGVHGLLALGFLIVLARRG